MKTHCISYVSGPYLGKKPNLENQMRSCGWFDSYKVFTFDDLNINFKREFSNILSEGRGGGYWIWKSQIISEYLKNIEYDDFLIYMDGGCTIHNSPEAKNRLDEYKNMLSDHDILRFIVNPFTEFEYTNSTTIDYFKNNYGLVLTEENKVQIMATIIIMKKTQNTINFFNEVDRILHNDPNLFTDYYNTYTPNPQFKDHRHDQSVMSLLSKCTKFSKFIDDETWFTNFENITHIPFLATRKNI